MVIFVLKSPQFSMNFHDNLKNRNWKTDFSFVSAHSASLWKPDQNWGGGVCISLVGISLVLYMYRTFIYTYMRIFSNATLYKIYITTLFHFQCKASIILKHVNPCNTSFYLWLCCKLCPIFLQLERRNSVPLQYDRLFWEL